MQTSISKFFGENRQQRQSLATPLLLEITEPAEQLSDVSPLLPSTFPLIQPSPQAASVDTCNIDDNQLRPQTNTENKTTAEPEKKSYGFNRKWLSQFKWLRLVDERKKCVSCNICRDEKVQSQWASEICWSWKTMVGRLSNMCNQRRCVSEFIETLPDFVDVECPKCCCGTRF